MAQARTSAKKVGRRLFFHLRLSVIMVYMRRNTELRKVRNRRGQVGGAFFVHNFYNSRRGRTKGIFRMPRKSKPNGKTGGPTPVGVDNHRSVIDVPGLLKALEAHVLAEASLSATQVSAALGLLKKALPDLQSTTVEGSVPTRVFVVSDTPDPKSSDDWVRDFSPMNSKRN